MNNLLINLLIIYESQNLNIPESDQSTILQILQTSQIY